MSVILKITEILEYLPHRYPFLLVDRVIDYNLAAKSIVGIKNVTINEPYFTGHFPGKPIMPGVLMIEAAAQISGVLFLLMHNVKPGDDNWFYLAGVDKARFRKIIVPGDQLILSAVLISNKLNVCKFAAKICVDDTVACSVDLLLAKGVMQ